MKEIESRGYGVSSEWGNKNYRGKNMAEDDELEECETPPDQSNKKDYMDRNRRFDVALLINCLPLIHIELKNMAHAYMQGFRQIKKYIHEDKFFGLFF